jgi:tetratricopeptide (TPR) repeat protein
MQTTKRIRTYLALTTVLTTSACSWLPASPPPEAVKHYEAGLAAKKAGDLETAQKQLLRSVVIDSENADAHWALAWVFAHQGDKAGAAGEFAQVLRLSPQTDRRREATAAIERLGALPVPGGAIAAFELDANRAVTSGPGGTVTV